MRQTIHDSTMSILEAYEKAVREIAVENVIRRLNARAYLILRVIRMLPPRTTWKQLRYREARFDF